MQRRFYLSLFLHPSVKIYYSDYSGDDDDDVCMYARTRFLRFGIAGRMIRGLCVIGVG